MGHAFKASEKRMIYPLCLLFAAVFVFLLSKSSPLYPINEWVDANIYFTIGKGMMHGRVPYLDLYDQKGPMAFLLFGLASLVSEGSFLGVYVVETIAFSFFLYAAYRIVSLYAQRYALIALPVLSAFILGSLSFSHGGSLEELMMPLFAWSLYDTLRYFKNTYPEPVPLKTIALNALFAGIMLFGKFTLLAFYIAWMGVIAISQLTAKHVKRAISSSLLFLAVMCSVGIPWVVYFGLNGGLQDFFHYYFYQNMFGYSYIENNVLVNTVYVIVKSVGAFFYRNLQIALLIVLGFVWFVILQWKRTKLVEKINVVLLFGLLACAIYMGGQGFRYYGLVLTPFMALGLAPIARFLETHDKGLLEKVRLRRALFGVLSLLMIGFGLLISDNRYMLSIPREETPQVRFASIMNERKTEDEITLFCYACPDAGFYLAADIIPAYRFFARVNVDLPELRQAQADYLAERSAEFVVTRNRDEAIEGYTLIETQTFWSEEQNDTFRLYQRAN
ncbi:MAG: hypothetical protein GX417_12655 [Clostridiales bacterium]|nr:hypothetical protein [Clostridiales bacterium]